MAIISRLMITNNDISNISCKSLHACTLQAKAPELTTIDIVVVCFQRF